MPKTNLLSKVCFFVSRVQSGKQVFGCFVENIAKLD